ncbi:MAG: hypothetical protein ACPGNT_07645 [Rhodospirillales bacterium]
MQTLSTESPTPAMIRAAIEAGHRARSEAFHDMAHALKDWAVNAFARLQQTPKLGGGTEQTCSGRPC